MRPEAAAGGRCAPGTAGEPAAAERAVASPERRGAAPGSRRTASYSAPRTGVEPRPTLDVCLASLLFDPMYAGPALRFKRYAPGLRERGIGMRVFCGTWEGDGAGKGAASGRGEVADGARKGDLLPPEVVDGIPVQRVRVPREAARGRLYWTYYRGLSRYCLRGERKPDVVQLLSPWITAVPWFARLRRAGIPLVYTHTMAGGSAGGRGVVGRLKGAIERLPLRVIDCIVVSSGVMRDELRDAGVAGRIEVIPNGTDLARFRPALEGERRELRRRLGFAPDEELVVFVGGFLNRRKGIDVLAAAWGLVAPRRPNARLVLVGPHHDAFAEAGEESEFLAGVRRALDDSGARDRVVLTGAVENVEDYLRAADIFVFPSRREGMPNVVPEAFGCGAPAILAPFEGLPAEFGRPGEQYVLVERTPEAFAAAIEGLLDSPERRAGLAARARRWVEEELDLERSLDLYAGLYRQLAVQATAARHR